VVQTTQENDDETDEKNRTMTDTPTKATEIIRELDNEEMEMLRAERDQALADLRSCERECAILRDIKPGVGTNNIRNGTRTGQSTSDSTANRFQLP